MSDASNDLKFTPLSEGLGFHPFSNGLPYAPVTKSPAGGRTPTTSTPSPFSSDPGRSERRYAPVQVASGTGAVAAGRPSFVTRGGTPPVHRLPPHAPQLGGSRARIAPSATSVVPRIAPTPAPSVDTLTNTPAALPAPVSARNYGFSYRLRRAIALALDLTLGVSLCVGLLGGVLLNQVTDLDLIFGSSAAPAAIAFAVFFAWSLLVAQEVLFGSTLGKRAVGLRLEAPASAILLRALLFIPSVGLAGLGLLWSAFDPQARCWHDLAVGVQPESSRD